MSDLVGNPKDSFSPNAAQLQHNLWRINVRLGRKIITDLMLKLCSEQIICIFDDNQGIILLIFFIKTYVVGAH